MGRGSGWRAGEDPSGEDYFPNSPLKLSSHPLICSPFPGAARRFALPSVGEMGGEDEEMGELPVFEDSDVEDEEGRGEEIPRQFDLDALEDGVGDEEEEDDNAEEDFKIEVAPDAADERELHDEDDGHGSHSGAQDQDINMSFEGQCAEDDGSVEEPRQPSFEDERNEREDELVEKDSGLQESRERSVTGDTSNQECNTSAVESPDKPLSFTRELSIEEEEEEERSIDRELSKEPEDGAVDEREVGPQVLSGQGERSVLGTARAYESLQQQRRSLSGRWDRSLKISDFSESASSVSRSQPQHDEDRATQEPMVDDEDDSNSEESMDEGVVTITSNDPLAAARAAAILKLVGLSRFIFIFTRIKWSLARLRLSLEDPAQEPSTFTLHTRISLSQCTPQECRRIGRQQVIIRLRRAETTVDDGRDDRRSRVHTRKSHNDLA